MAKLTLKDVSDIIMHRETTRARENKQKLLHEQKSLLMLLDAGDCTCFKAKVLNFVHHETKYALGVPTAHVDAASTIPGIQIPGGNWYRWVDKNVCRVHNPIPSTEEMISAVQLLNSVGLDVMAIPMHAEHNGDLRDWPFHLRIFYSNHNTFGDPMKSLLSRIKHAFPHALWHARVPREQCVLDMSLGMWENIREEAEPHTEYPVVGDMLQQTAAAFWDKKFAIAQWEAAWNKNTRDHLCGAVEFLLSTYTALYKP